MPGGKTPRGFESLPLRIKLVVSSDPFSRSNKPFESYYRGRKGESIIFEELKKLPDGFRVFCDIKIAPPYNIDFLVAGPTGIFTVEVKSHPGAIGYADGKITINNLVPKEKDFLKQAKGEAKSISEYLKKKIGTDHWVSPVLAFSNPGAKMHFGLNPVDGVVVVQRGFLLKLLLGASGQQLQETALLDSERSLLQLMRISHMPTH